MRFRLTAGVQGDGVAKESMQFDSPPYRVGLEVDEKGELARIWVDASVEDFEPFLTRMTARPGRAFELTVRRPPVAEELLGLLQHIESMGSFWLGIHQLDWRSAEMRWMPESPDEEKKVGLLSFANRLEYP